MIEQEEGKMDRPADKEEFPGATEETPVREVKLTAQGWTML